MIKIRLFQVGKKNKIFYRLVAAEEGTKRNGKVLENLGFYNPEAKLPTLKINQERVDYWLSRGAQPTTTVKKLLANEKSS